MQCTSTSYKTRPASILHFGLSTWNSTINAKHASLNKNPRTTKSEHPQASLYLQDLATPRATHATSRRAEDCMQISSITDRIVVKLF